MKLKGQTAIVTGAARGIGQAIATHMAQAGAHVVLGDLLGESLERVVSELTEAGHDAVACVADVSTVAGNQAMVSCAESRFGRIDIFHANAAILQFTMLHAMQATAVDKIIDANLKGVIHGCSAVLPHMIRQGSGVILMTASVLASVGDPELPVYGATKGALKALCRSVAVKYGPQGIRCNTISPGDVRTQLFEDFIAQSADPVQARRLIVDAYPLRRIAEPEDVARVAVFLASTDAAFITGTDVLVDGGLTAQCY